MDRLIERVVLPSHPLLGRNVNHDSASRAYRVQPRRAGVIRPVRHESHIAILDQGQLGSCTGNAGVSAIYHHPYPGDTSKPYPGYGPDEAGAVSLYSAATQIDPYAGEYPPEDTGSDGLSIAKVLKAKGVISGYLWAFTLAEALAQLADTPEITGLIWYNSMFDTTDSGHAGHLVVRQDSGVAGGHEICVDEVITPSNATVDVAQLSSMADQIFVGGPNSWGRSFGDDGRWYMTAREWGSLLAQQGDVTSFVAASLPEPQPQPDPGTVDEKAAGDKLFRSVPKGWLKVNHVGDNAKAAKAVKAWAKATNRL